MYASYEFYQEFRNGTTPILNDLNYNYYAAKANDFIMVNTNALIADHQILELMLDKLKKCECEIAENLYKFESEDNTQSSNKTNETQDGYSVAYRDTQAKNQERQARLKYVLKTYLLTPVNLVYGGQ